MKLRSTPSRPSRTLTTIAGWPGRRRQAVDAALKVLGRLDHVGGEFLHRVLARIVDVLAGAGADVGVLGLGPHPAVLHLRQFGFQLGDAGGRRLHHLFGRQGRVLPTSEQFRCLGVCSSWPGVILIQEPSVGDLFAHGGCS